LNKIQAEALEESLKGKQVGQWTVGELINYGKSAAVFCAKNDETTCALKIYDNELVETYGKYTQLERIERQVSLSNHTHPNLITIYGGGCCEKTNLLYIVMEKIDSPDLGACLKSVSKDRIRQIIRNIANAAQFLETLKIAHRDIKPANIVLTDERAVLLDLGVLRPIGNPGDTDDNQLPFVGTHQYSPPEFIFRTEEDSIKGWRAVTFYQLGAVLYDLIEKTPIFESSKQPIARLVDAIKSEKPKISALDAPFDLVKLAENCLTKDPNTRLELVSWEDFDKEPLPKTERNLAKERLLGRSKSQHGDVTYMQQIHERKVKVRSVAGQICDAVRSECISEEALPPVVTTEIEIDVPTAEFRLIFAPNYRYGLKGYFAVQLEVQVLDFSDEAIVVKCMKYSGSSTDELLERIGNSVMVYQGMLHIEELCEAALDFILPAIETYISCQDELVD